MIFIRRLIAALLILALFLPSALAEDMPAWEYPLLPEIIEDFDEYLILTNRSELLSSDYQPRDLVNITAKRASSDKMQLRQAASDALSAMFDAASQAGYTLYAKSAYRSYKTQKTMYDNRLEANHGRDDGYVAYPGSSDHQTGLGVDILNYEWTKKDGMNENFARAQEAQWLAAHCQEFGFVLRYMEDKVDVTGIHFEPWHFRYVGLEAAQYIMENHLSLEEFTQEWRDYIASWEASGGNFQELLRRRRRMNDATVLQVFDDGEAEISIYFTKP